MNRQRRLLIVLGAAAVVVLFLGHASVTITFDRYGHLMPGNETEAAARLDAYLVAAAERR